MRRKKPPSNEEYWSNVKRATRIAERLEHELRLAVPSCWVSTSVREFATLVDLRVGLAEQEGGEQLCVQSMEVDGLEQSTAVERLVRVVEAWRGSRR